MISWCSMKRLLEHSLVYAQYSSFSSCKELVSLSKAMIVTNSQVSQ